MVRQSEHLHTSSWSIRPQVDGFKKTSQDGAFGGCWYPNRIPILEIAIKRCRNRLGIRKILLKRRPRMLAYADAHVKASNWISNSSISEFMIYIGILHYSCSRISLLPSNVIRYGWKVQLKMESTFQFRSVLSNFARRFPTLTETFQLQTFQLKTF